MASTAKKKIIISAVSILAVAILVLLQIFVLSKTDNKTICGTDFKIFRDSDLKWESSTSWTHTAILLKSKAVPDLEELNFLPDAVKKLNYTDLPGRSTYVSSMKNPLNGSLEFLIFRGNDQCSLVSLAKEYKSPWGFGSQKSSPSQQSVQCQTENHLAIFKGYDDKFYMYDSTEIIKKALTAGISYGECKDGKKNGVWRSRHSITPDSSREIPFLTSKFDDGKPIGVWKVQGPSGAVVYEADMENNPEGVLITCEDIVDSEQTSQQGACRKLLDLRVYPDDGAEMLVRLKWKK